MYDEDSDGDIPLSRPSYLPPSSIDKRDSPPESIYEEEELFEEIEDSQSIASDYNGGNFQSERRHPHQTTSSKRNERMNKDLSMIEERISDERIDDDDEDEEMRKDNTTHNQFDSLQFVNGGDALAMIEQNEMERQKKHIFIQDDPRFDRTFNEKENSWEPSPYQSILEDKVNTENNKSDRQVLPTSEMDRSQNKTKSSTKVVTFSNESPDTRTLPPISALSSSSSTITLCNDNIQKNNRSPSPPSRPPHVGTIDHTEQQVSSLPSHMNALTLIPPSPTESNNSIIPTSTPNDRMSTRQHRVSLRTRFSDISALEESIKKDEVIGSSRPSLSNRGKVDETTASSNASISVSGVLNAIKTANPNDDLMAALERARSAPRRVRLAELGRSKGETSSRSSVSSRSATVNKEDEECYPPYPHTNRYSNAPSSTNQYPAPSSSTVPPSSTVYTIRYQSTTFSVPPSSRAEDGEEKQRMGRSADYGRSNGNTVGLPPRMPFRSMQRGDDIGRGGERTIEKKETNNDSIILDRKSSMSIRTDDRSGRDSAASNASERSSRSGMNSTSNSGSGRGGKEFVCSQNELLYGNVAVGDMRVLTFKTRSVLQYPVTCTFTLKSYEKKKERGPIFQIVNGHETLVRPGEQVECTVQFKPNMIARFHDRLIMSVSGAGHNGQYKINMFGFGGVAHMLVMQRTGLFPQRNSCDFVLHTSTIGQLAIGVENTGDRTAYVRVTVVDKEGRRVEGVNVTPSNSFVCQKKSTQPIKLDLSRVDLSNNGRTSGMGFRRSSTTSINSIGSSASSTSSIPSSVAYTVLLYWGEDTTRQRMIAACHARGHSSFPPLCPIDENFSHPFNGETRFIPPPDYPIRSSDIDIFIASIKTTKIHVVVSGSTTFIEDSTDGDRTLVADDTFRPCDDTIRSVAPDMTVLRVRR